MDPTILTGASIGTVLIFAILGGIRLYAVYRAFRQGNVRRLKLTWRGLEIEMAEPPEPPPTSISVRQHRQQNLQHEDHGNQNPAEHLDRLGYTDVVPNDRHQKQDEKKLDHV